MVALLQDLVQHKGHANALLLRAIRQHEPAARDRELLTMLHHMHMANRFWLMLCQDRPFVPEDESVVPDSLDPIVRWYHDTQTQESAWVSMLGEADFARTVETPYIPGHRFTVAQAMTQVCLHSHGHRAQCATRLRGLGGTPPAMDFVLWLTDRRAPDWPMVPDAGPHA